MSLRDVPVERLRTVARSARSIRELLRILGFCSRGRCHNIAKELLRVHAINTDHFRNVGSFTRRLTDVEFFAAGVEREGVQLKRRLLSGGYATEKCSICDLGPVWNDKPLALQVDHKNGKRSDCRIINLRLVCPNCHSQTETYGGRQHKKSSRNCSKCQTPIWRGNKVGLCRECLRRQNTQRLLRFNPTYEQLVAYVSQNSLNSIGKSFGVSGHTVRKRCEQYEIDWRALRTY